MKICTHLLFSVSILIMLAVSAGADNSSSSVTFRLSVILPESISAPVTTTNVNPTSSNIMSPSLMSNNEMFQSITENNKMVMYQQEKTIRNNQSVLVNTLVVL